MNNKGPKNDGKYEWTEHSKFKMQYYGLSPQRVLRVIRAPYRTETGIVENTIAVMQPGGNVKKGPAKSKWGKASFGDGESEVSADGKSWSSEIWVMYQIRNQESGDRGQEIKKLKSQIKNIKLEEKAEKLMKLIPKKLRIISAWRYPGVTDENDPIPAEILREIEGII